MSAHTTGPWRATRIAMRDADAWEIRAPHGSLVCKTSFWDTGKADANALLIAAAPDLLAALQFCENYAQGLQAKLLNPGGERVTIAELCEIENKARIAIAKAGGAK